MSGFLAAAGMAMLVAACVPGPATLIAASPPALTVSGSEHYAAIPDHGFVVPAVPVEKMAPEFLRQTVDYPTDLPAGTVIIDPSAKHLYLITGRNRAVRYGIAVGRAGFGWSGEAEIAGRTTWPMWTPPPEMILRRPELAKFRNGEPGGLENPLGARALYLQTNGIDYGYRIHGTPEWDSIGQNASSGCIRMLNQDVMELYDRIPDGTRVIVLTEAGEFPARLMLPPPAPRLTAKRPAPPPPDLLVEPAAGPV